MGIMSWSCLLNWNDWKK